MLKNLTGLTRNKLLCELCNELIKLVKSSIWRRRQPSWFTTLPEFVAKALNVVEPKSLQLESGVFDEDENVVMSLGSQQALKSFY